MIDSDDGDLQIPACFSGEQNILAGGTASRRDLGPKLVIVCRSMTETLQRVAGPWFR